MTSLSSAARLADALAAIPAVEIIGATFVSLAGGLATVLQGGSTIAVRSSSQYPLIPGDPVLLQRKNGQVVLIGPAKPRSATGKITATGSPQCTVEYPAGSGVTALMPYNSAYTPAVNDAVLISWDAQGGAVVGKLTALPTIVTPAAPSAGSGTQYHPDPFTAIDSGSFRSGSWWTDDVYSADSNIGAWFYGSKIRDTIPDSASILSARIYLPLRAKNASGSPLLGIHNQDAKPGGTVTVGSTVAIAAGAAGWLSIPTSFIDTLKATAGGFGFNHGGYTIWRGHNSDPLSGALDITYTA